MSEHVATELMADERVVLIAPRAVEQVVHLFEVSILGMVLLETIFAIPWLVASPGIGSANLGLHVFLFQNSADCVSGDPGRDPDANCRPALDSGLRTTAGEVSLVVLLVGQVLAPVIAALVLRGWFAARFSVMEQSILAIDGVFRSAKGNWERSVTLAARVARDAIAGAPSVGAPKAEEGKTDADAEEEVEEVTGEDGLGDLEGGGGAGSGGGDGATAVVVKPAMDGATAAAALQRLVRQPSALNGPIRQPSAESFRLPAKPGAMTGTDEPADARALRRIGSEMAGTSGRESPPRHLATCGGVGPQGPGLRSLGLILGVVAVTTGLVAAEFTLDHTSPFDNNRLLYCVIVYIFNGTVARTGKWLNQFLLSQPFPARAVSSLFLLQVLIPLANTVFALALPAIVLLPPGSLSVTSSSMASGAGLEYLIRVAGTASEIFTFAYLSSLIAQALRWLAFGLQVVLPPHLAARIPSEEGLYGPNGRSILLLQLMGFAAFLGALNALVIPFTVLLLVAITFLARWRASLYVRTLGTTYHRTPVQTLSGIDVSSLSLVFLPTLLLSLPALSLLGSGVFLAPISFPVFLSITIIAALYLLFVAALGIWGLDTFAVPVAGIAHALFAPIPACPHLLGPSIDSVTDTQAPASPDRRVHPK